MAGLGLGGDGMGSGYGKVGGGGVVGALLPDRQLVHGAAKCCGGRGGLNK